MKGVGFGGTPFKDQEPRKPQDDTTQWTISPDGFADSCYSCGVKFAENEGNAVIKVVGGKMTSQRRHRGCPEPEE
jgi:hypothetical protein